MVNGADPASDRHLNQLLGSLPAIEWRRIQPNLELMKLPFGEILCESDSRLRQAYFPTTSIISLMHVTAEGRSTEFASVGNEGLVGIGLFTGGSTTSNRVVVQNEGQAYRLPGEILRTEFMRGGAMQYLLLRYTQARLTQIGQTAVCNRRHTIDQRLCRWLLLGFDRLASAELTMTHELLANTLGVRREGITEAALKLQANGLIRYYRARIELIDRAGLEAYSCECYGIVRQALDCLAAPSDHPQQGLVDSSVPWMKYSSAHNGATRSLVVSTSALHPHVV